jgi:hypothetical protein
MKLFGTKDNRPSSYASDSSPNKPSLNAQPNLGIPPGGYTDGALAGRSAASMSTTPPEHWTSHNSITQQDSTNAFGNYSVPEPSQSPSYSTADFASQGGSYQFPAQQGQFPYGQQIGNMTSYGDHSQTAYQQPYTQTSGYGYQQRPDNVPMSGYAVAPSGPYGPSNFGEQQHDPYAQYQPQQQTVPSGWGVEQQSFAPYGQPYGQQSGFSVANPSLYNQPSTGGTHNSPY